jgi:hypothetical protein
VSEPTGTVLREGEVPKVGICRDLSDASAAEKKALIDPGLSGLAGAPAGSVEVDRRNGAAIRKQIASLGPFLREDRKEENGTDGSVPLTARRKGVSSG